jgi:hypothetical protein
MIYEQNYYTSAEFKEYLYSMVLYALGEVYKKHSTFLDMGSVSEKTENSQQAA